MKKNSKNIMDEVNAFFEESPGINQKAWGVINQFYHLILTYMEENNISQAELAAKTGKSRSAVSQLFSKTPNISVKKMVEIADAIGINIEISSPQVEDQKNKESRETVKVFKYQFEKNWAVFSGEIDKYQQENSAVNEPSPTYAASDNIFELEYHNN